VRGNDSDLEYGTLREGEAMRVRTFRLLVLVTSTTALAGCACRQPSAKEACPPSAPAEPFVFYDEAGDPSEKTPPLSEGELRKIVDWVAVRMPRPIWLIRVKPSYSDGRRAGVVAYLVPDEATPRMRIGGALTVFQREIPAPPRKYVQVSPADHCSTDQLTKPSVLDLPFVWPTVVDPNGGKSSPMSSEELISIVDFVRQPSNYQDPALRYWHEKPYELPILSVRREGNMIRVSFGYEHGFLWARGCEIMVKRTTTGYEVVSCSRWLS
jgi:hypothetical protein